MNCPYCQADDDKVVDSRPSEDGGAVRRRRECLSCGRRYPTHERAVELPLMVVKRSGLREPFDRAKIADGIEKALAGAEIAPEALEAIVDGIEEDARASAPEVASEQLGLGVLEHRQCLYSASSLRLRLESQPHETLIVFHVLRVGGSDGKFVEYGV